MTIIKVETAAPLFLKSRIKAFIFMQFGYNSYMTKHIDMADNLNKFDRDVLHSIYRFTDDLITDLRNTYFKDTAMSQFITQKHIMFSTADELVYNDYCGGLWLKELVEVRERIANFML